MQAKSRETDPEGKLCNQRGGKQIPHVLRMLILETFLHQAWEQMDLKLPVFPGSRKAPKGEAKIQSGSITSHHHQHQHQHRHQHQRQHHNHPKKGSTSVNANQAEPKHTTMFQQKKKKKEKKKTLQTEGTTAEQHPWLPTMEFRDV